MLTNQPLLEVRNLEVSFTVSGREVPILNNFSFTLDVQQTLGIVGESGSGKTVTALSILRLLATPPLCKMSGEIRFQGRNLLSLVNREMQTIRGKEIGFIFQEPMTALNPVFTIGDQIVEIIMTHSKVRKREAWEHGISLLKEVGIPTPELHMNSYSHELSGGMRQRAMIAMALCCGPRILIADEPTTALDVTVQAQILELFMALRQERRMSIIFITHDLRVIAEIADQVLVIHHGSMVEYDRVENIFHAPAHPFTKEQLRLITGRNLYGSA